MKTNKGQRKIIREKAVLAKHEYFADDVCAMCDDIDELSALLALAAPFVDADDIRARMNQEVRV